MRFGMLSANMTPPDNGEPGKARDGSLSLYRACRWSNNISALASGHPPARRAVNVAKGRALGRAGVWARLWK